jgi:hypothetical protein
VTECYERPIKRVHADLVVELGPFVHQPRRIANGATRRAEVELRAMLEKATGFQPNVVEGRFMVHTRHQQHPWIIIVEPDSDADYKPVRAA